MDLSTCLKNIINPFVSGSYNDLIKKGFFPDPTIYNFEHLKKALRCYDNRLINFFLRFTKREDFKYVLFEAILLKDVPTFEHLYQRWNRADDFYLYKFIGGDQNRFFKPIMEILCPPNDEKRCTEALKVFIHEKEPIPIYYFRRTNADWSKVKATKISRKTIREIVKRIKNEKRP